MMTVGSVLSKGFIQAANHSPGNLPVNLVVIHDEEYPEVPGGARHIALDFAGRPTSGPRAASAHYTVDDKEIWQCVSETDIAWHCGHNAHSIGIEQGGYASQSALEWDDPYSHAQIELVARLTADICHRYGIPPVWLSPADLVAGKEGITSHNNIRLAYPGSTTHTDPGPNFPSARFVARVAAILHPQEDDVQQADIDKIVHGVVNQIAADLGKDDSVLTKVFDRRVRKSIQQQFGNDPDAATLIDGRDNPKI